MSDPVHNNTMLRAYFENYGRYHQTKGNKMTHLIGIPLVTFSIIGLVGRLTVPLGFADANLAFLIAGGLSIWYFLLEWRLALAFVGAFFTLFYLAQYFTASALWVAFAIGWAFQLLGHYYYEKNSPAFMTNLFQLGIGPLWFLYFIFYRKKVG
jgi:uncharacterized membrane protein YGL010W